MDRSSDNRIIPVIEETTSENAVQNVPQPRQPHNLQELLRYAVEAGSMISNSNDASIDQLEPERREFLENAISQMTVNISEELQKKVEILKKIENDDGNISSVECAMDELTEYLDNMDFANDFCKLGGLTLCQSWLENGPPNIRWRASELIALCTQNNTFCQNQAVKILKPLMKASLSDEDEKTRIKAFYAVSCIVRSNQTALMQFLSLNGHKLLLASLKSSNQRMRTKAAFLLSSIAGQEPMFRDQLFDSGVVQEVIALVSSQNDESMEHILAALLSVIQDHPRSAELCRQSTTLHSQLVNLIEKDTADEALIEEVQYAKKILKLISK